MGRNSKPHVRTENYAMRSSNALEDIHYTHKQNVSHRNPPYNCFLNMAIVTNSHRGPLWGVLFIIIIITLFPIRSSHTAKICAKGNSDSTASTSSCLSHDLNNGQSSLQEYKYFSCLHLFIYVQKIGAPPPAHPFPQPFLGLIPKGYIHVGITISSLRMEGVEIHMSIPPNLLQATDSPPPRPHPHNFFKKISH